MIVFAFKDTVAEKIVKGLPQENIFYIESNKKAIYEFVDHLCQLKPKRILGLGNYSGVDRNKIRIETKCKNKFRNKVIIPSESQELNINYWVNPSKDFKLACGIGNSYCNLVSYLIMNANCFGKLNCEYTFLHIPKGLLL